MIIEKEIWHKVWKYISHSHWKVQIGFVTWWALMVEGSGWENDVDDLLNKAKFKDANTRQAAVAIMSVFSDYYKVFKFELDGISNIPWWVFSGADCIFGYTETETGEHNGWQGEVLEGILSWISKRDSENFAQLSLDYDMEMSMEHFLKDFKVSVTKCTFF
jgi:hypothetical protein